MCNDHIYLKILHALYSTQLYTDIFHAYTTTFVLWQILLYTNYGGLLGPS